MTHFFYGSLRSGFWNHGFLRGQEFVSNAVTLSNFRLYVGYGGVPFVVADSTGYPIIGEVWELDRECQLLIDQLETGYSSMTIEVKKEDGEKVDSIIYYADSKASSGYSSGPNDYEELSGDYSNAVNGRGERRPNWTIKPIYAPLANIEFEL